MISLITSSTTDPTERLHYEKRACYYLTNTVNPALMID